MWRVVLAGLLVIGAQSFTPTVIRWTGLPAKRFVLSPRAQPKQAIISSNDVAPPQKLTIWDQPLRHKSLSNEIPYFTPRPDKTITWGASDLCIEASGDRSGDAVSVSRCNGAPKQRWEFLPLSSGNQNQVQIRLEDAAVCLYVKNEDKERDWNEATVELRDCSEKVTESWELDEATAFPAHGPSQPVLSSSLRHVPTFVISMAMLVATSLGAWMWRWRRSSMVASSKDGMPPTANLSGVSLTVPMAASQGRMPSIFDQRGIPVVMTSSPKEKPISETLKEEDSIAIIDFEKNLLEVESVCKRRFFYRQGYEMYGGVAGFYTYGPPGCALKANIIQQWRSHFVLEEKMMEIEDSTIMPHAVLKASGHVDRFSDFLVRDVEIPQNCFRADKLLEEVMDKKINGDGVTEIQKQEYTVVRNKADGYSKEELMDVFRKYDVKAPDSGNELTEPEPYNLMFPTPIGPGGLIQGFLRPETAQGIFLNYRLCLEQNSNRLPFGVAQVGRVYRNEIAPRNGLTRMREFSQMEIEWFVKPTDKQTPKFDSVRHLTLQLFSADLQEAGKPHVEMVIGEAVEKGIVDNETLGYFIARTYLFLTSIGIKQHHLRFRQHLSNEMAHYATDCWDAEIETSIGWLECVGIADRACFDLSAHAEATNRDLKFREKLETPVEVQVTTITKVAGINVMKAFKKQGRDVKAWLESLPETELRSLSDEANSKGEAKRTVPLSDGDQECTFVPAQLELETNTEKQTTRTFMPGVVEPSFGIDRIFFACIEHAYYARPTEQAEDGKQTRGVLSFPAAIAPYKMTILPVDSRITREEKYGELLQKLSGELSSLGISYTLDDTSASIGKRYSRNDEVGIPFACTIDMDSFKDGSVTVRERDSMAQVRVMADDVGTVMHEIVWGRKTWKDVQAQFAEFSAN